jgi:cytochrome c
MLRNLLVGFYCLLIFSSCQKEKAISELERPHDPWVIRSVLDGNPRMITLALNKNLWVAYSTEEGALYKAWGGWVLFDGPVYTTKHGPQPVSIGDSFIENEHKKPWIVKKNGSAGSFTYQYKGHKFNWPHVSLMHELQLEDGTSIRIDEQVEYTEKESGQKGLERIFTSSNLDDNMEIGLKINVSSIIIKDHVETDGNWEVIDEENIQIGDRTALEVDGVLWLNKNSITNFSCYFTDQPLIPNVKQEESDKQIDTSLPDGALLIAQNDCRICHNDKVKTVGPAYTDVARKYLNNESTVELLVNKVIKGGSGIWGTQEMNAHPNLSEAKARIMVQYILDMGTEENKAKISASGQEKPRQSIQDVRESDLILGAYVKVFSVSPNVSKIPETKRLTKPVMAGVMPNFDNLSGSDFKDLDENFILRSSGYLNIPASKNYSFRVWSDEDAKFYLDNELILDHDGLNEISFKEITVNLEKGYHPFKLNYFQRTGTKFLSLNWKPEGEEKWKVIPPNVFAHPQTNHLESIDLSLPMAIVNKIPGNQNPLAEVHPAFDLSQARPDDFRPMVGGMDFLKDGQLVVSTWDAEGAVYLVKGVQSGDPKKMSVKKIASGLAEPLGLKVVDNEIYVMQKQELTRLVDTNGDEIIDEYHTLCDAWKVSSNFHEFGFGLAYKNGQFYATLATAIEPGGASTQPQLSDRGKVIKVSKESGAIEFIADGLRTPNGIGIGFNGEIFVADNQGDWLPSSKIVHVKSNAWFGSRSVDFEGTEGRKENLPVVWLPQDEIGNSPSTPSFLHVGPYAGQMIHGEVTHGGIKRVFVEEVNENLQGAVFRFIQGLESGVNRIGWGPDGALYIGGIGNPGNWGQSGKKWYGLQRLAYNKKSVFEMLAIRAKSNGIEIEFTEPLRIGEGWNVEDYLVKQWYYLPTVEYGGPKLDEKKLNILSVNISDDRKRVFLELEGMKSNHVIYVHLKNQFVSEKNHSLWSTEGWYTMNILPTNELGFKSMAPEGIGVNQLTQEEKNLGWKLLFDGISFEGWRGYKKDEVTDVWRIEDGAMTLDTIMTSDGRWTIEGYNDIITKREYENFELILDWKIQNCGNSGIFYLVKETGDFQEAYFTGPEMQILDNVCHLDGKVPTHRAGDLYDIINSNITSVKSAGEWNRARILVNNGHVEHWLNGYKVVEFKLWNAEWDEMVSNSKFKDWPFAKTKSGHISLQEHNDKVWFRNIKLREL